MREVWMEAKGFPDYLVSNHGNIIHRATGEPVRIFLTKGREVANLTFEGQNFLVMVPRVIAGTFFDAELEGMEVNHIDGNRHNNAIWNLEVITREENREHACGMNLMRPPIRIRNLDTGEIYQSAAEAGRRLGYLSGIHIPKKARESGAEFECGGYRLILV